VRQAKLDRAGWETYVAMMIGRGAKLDEAERKAVIDFLAGGQRP